MSRLLSPEELEGELRALGAARYHDRHPFHRLLHSGALDRRQVQAWALNRYYYQSRIPIKDASILARMEDPALRRAWRQRVLDHDGDDRDGGEAGGGIARWLKLAEAVGLDLRRVAALEGVLPATRFSVDAYIHFVRERSLLEAIASSLTELFAPKLIASRVEGMLASYDFVDQEALAYFTARLSEAPRDAEFALNYVKREARRPDQQQAVIAALRFKCEVLWTQLDALHHAYVEPGLVPPDAFGWQEETRI